jgi:very-short-patch-repair endonuclease
MDMESILDEVTSMFQIQDNRGNVKPLTRHYRSNDERLISWSNFHIYRPVGEALSSFPSTAGDPSVILRHSYIEGVRVADMSHPNEVEIDKVIKIVKVHVKENFELSLGIIGFGKRHSDRLQDAFNILEKEDPEFYSWKTHWNEHREKFFVKNIENVQGDERDAILISPGYAPNLEGNLLLRFGSLNLAGGERRLNVAASRAKVYMHLVTSLRSHEFDLARTDSRGVALFKTYIEFMERHGYLDNAPDRFAVPESPFEEQILKALRGRGLLVDPQVGESNFRIDFGIRDPKTNRYLLAVEADGATYHSSPYARERDWLREQVLRQKGWKFVRIWSTDWWENSDHEVTRVLDAFTEALAQESQRQSGEHAKVSTKPVATSEYEGNPEYELLRGILAQMPTMPKEDLLTQWMALLGLQRRVTPMLERFENYYEQAKMDIRSSEQQL